MLFRSVMRQIVEGNSKAVSQRLARANGVPTVQPESQPPGAPSAEIDGKSRWLTVADREHARKTHGHSKTSKKESSQVTAAEVDDAEVDE